MSEITNKRNAHGVKFSADCYRHIGGELFMNWHIGDVRPRAAAYRKAKIKFRTIRGEELLIRETDQERAIEIDQREGFQ